MSHKGITEKPEIHATRGDWQPLQETAPSLMRVDEPALGRFVGFGGLMLLALGGTALLLSLVGKGGLVNPGLAALFLVGGVGGLLFHAACDSDLQVRRIYGLLGFGCLAAGGIFSAFYAIPVVGGFLPGGFISLTVGLLFLLPFARHETDPMWRKVIHLTLGGVGAVLALVGLGGAAISQWFLAPYGLLLALLGLVYLWTFISQEGATTDLGYRIAQLVGLAGAVLFLIGLGRSVLPSLFWSWRWISSRPDSYFIPAGLLVMTLGLVYLGLSLGLCSDNRLVVMTRRELASYFTSPVAYLVLLGMSIVGWVLYLLFVLQLSEEARLNPQPEPVVSMYILHWAPVICVIFVIPALTMRLMSEEKRSGTMEVMLTSPVAESSVVLSKFFAVWFFYLLLWVPWGLYLIGLGWGGGRAFEYTPLITFFIVLAFTGAGFLSMGLFFSSVTRNQVIAAVLTFAMMLVYTMAFLGRRHFMTRGQGQAESPWSAILTHVSYIDLWISSMQGILAPQFLIYHLSAAVFGLFLTVKVLESRKWW